jgi:hypothetical protein
LQFHKSREYTTYNPKYFRSVILNRAGHNVKKRIIGIVLIVLSVSAVIYFLAASKQPQGMLLEKGDSYGLVRHDAFDPSKPGFRDPSKMVVKRNEFIPGLLDWMFVITLFVIGVYFVRKSANTGVAPGQSSRLSPSSGAHREPQLKR